MIQCHEHKPLGHADTSADTFIHYGWVILTLGPLNQIYPAFANSVDQDQLASEEANWSGSALFVVKNVNLYQQHKSNKIWLAEN